MSDPSPIASKGVAQTSIQALRGHRPYMEDFFHVAADGCFAAVYDGHGGYLVSRYLKANLFNQMCAVLNKDGENGLDDDTAPAKVRKALVTSLAKVERDVVNVPAWNEQGSTVAAAVVVDGDASGSKVVVTANIGDSRIVLSRLGTAVELTEDHKPNAPAEVDRIQRLGGTVKWHGFLNNDGTPMAGTGVYRVNGNLAVSRAVGDASEKPYISAKPDILFHELEAEKDQFIIIATDGLWDVMSSEEAVRYVHTIMAGALGGLRQGTSFGGGIPLDRIVQHRISENAARHPHSDRSMIRATMASRKRKISRYLAEEAMRRGTSDNITVIVLWLQ
eukprot:CAMPEP_0185755476 /NCGR_PEP_ID=MMETSP1174-20130828/13967_1 /TAXON_ID=35687 /ORGANISM="Dictyocha speculum, Strain CCMP1381" /LENGTH=332 /DNA_ID=CAMNT_0028434037 /DNA_START=218 /DNA_END=1216 /DNA_ORIENTATION=+